MSLHKEISFEAEVCQHLGAHGWLSTNWLTRSTWERLCPHAGSDAQPWAGRPGNLPAGRLFRGDLARTRRRLRAAKSAGGCDGHDYAAIEAQLNERQKEILLEVQKTGRVTSGWCRKRFGVALLTVQRDLAGLVGLGLIGPVGKGRGARYVLKAGR